MILYQHDATCSFRFQLLGDLEGSAVDELAHAWQTARSIMNGKALIVDLSALGRTDEAGMQLLIRLRDSGARFTFASHPRQLKLERSLGIEEKPPIGRELLSNAASRRRRLAHVARSVLCFRQR
jgi:ABC-type transporter Mla MlaB component